MLSRARGRRLVQHLEVQLRALRVHRRVDPVGTEAHSRTAAAGDGLVMGVDMESEGDCDRPAEDGR